MNIYSNIKIVVVDDHSFLRTSMCSLLKLRYGFTVLFDAENGVDCLEKLKQLDTLPDVCVLDIKMPVMDGYETAKAMKLLYPTIKIIAYSLDSDKWTIEKIMDSGADLFLSKAAESGKLENAIISLAQAK